MSLLLALWDVDNTLIANGGVSKDAYGGAFELLTGRAVVHRARTGGSTDPLIMADLMERHGLTLTPERVAGLPSALEAALSARRDDLAARGRELPGARAALLALADHGGVVQGVLTGNIRPNAHTKLAVFDLAGPPLDWDASGFGSDDEVRANLVGIAQRRAKDKYGEVFERHNTVLIGDTPNDVRAGLHGGAKVLAVASGSDTAEALKMAGADAVIPDLVNTDHFVEEFRRLVRAG